MNRRFWELVCGAYPAIILLFGLNVTLFVLLGLTFPFVTPDSGSYYASLLAGGLLAVTMIPLIYVIRTCRSR